MSYLRMILGEKESADEKQDESEGRRKQEEMSAAVVGAYRRHECG